MSPTVHCGIHPYTNIPTLCKKCLSEKLYNLDQTWPTLWGFCNKMQWCSNTVISLINYSNISGFLSHAPAFVRFFSSQFHFISKQCVTCKLGTIVLILPSSNWVFLLRLTNTWCVGWIPPRDLSCPHFLGKEMVVQRLFRLQEKWSYYISFHRYMNTRTELSYVSHVAVLIRIRKNGIWYKNPKFKWFIKDDWQRMTGIWGPRMALNTGLTIQLH